jgi:hypothetical protein
MGGVHEDTYWSQRIISDESADIVSILEATTSSLEAHRSFLQDFVATGGEIEYFIGWFTTDISGGDTLSWELLERLAALRINLSLDVYGNK